MRIDYTKTSPAGVKALGSVYGYITQSGLDPALVELTYLRISQINGCAYCLDMHTRDLTRRGVDVQKLALVQVWHEAGSLFSDREKAALAWAESVTRVATTGRRLSYVANTPLTAPVAVTPRPPARAGS